MNKKYLGRGGDTEIRNVKNKSSHVNTWEAFLIDNYGDQGQNVVTALGSGTKNPSTKMPEYAWFDGGKEDAQEGKTVALDIMAEGMSAIGQDLTRSLELAGDEYGLGAEQKLSATGTSLQDIETQKESQIGATGLAYSGTVNVQADEAKQNIQNQLNLALDELALGKLKSEASSKQQASQRLEELKANYQATIQELDWPWYADDYDEARGYEALQSDLS